MNLSSEYVGIHFPAVEDCGHSFAIRRVDYDAMVEAHASIWCPICKSERWYDGESRIERAERLLKVREWERDRAREQAASEMKSARAYKGHLTRQRKRSAAGVCPCCNRTFQSLARHMASQHPGYAGEEEKP